MSLWRRLRGGSAPTRLPETVVGVVHDIEQLVGAINDPTRPAADRVAAAGLVRSSIETTAVSSIQELWYSTRTLLDLENVSDVRRAGWRLLRCCIDHDDINNGAFAIYYHTIVSLSNVEDFDLVLDCLQALTAGGKRILGGGQLSPCRLPLVLISWVQVLAVRAQELRANSLARDVLEGWGTSTEQCLNALLEFTVATLKFSMAVWEPTDLENLLLMAVAIVKSTSSLSDASLACTVVSTVMAFGILPVAVLQPVLEVLCGLYTMVPALAPQSWTIIQSLSQSHLRGSTLARLRRVLQAQGPGFGDVSVNMRVGAASILSRLALEGTENVEPLLDLFVAYQSVLEVERADPTRSISPKLEAAIAAGTLRLLRDSGTLRESRAGLWLWQTGLHSPLAIVHDLGNSNSPDVRSLVSEILDVLTELLLDRSTVLPYDETLDLCLELWPLLSSQGSRHLVTALKAVHFCSPYLPGWSRRVRRVLTALYSPPNSASRVSVLDLVQDLFFVGGDDDESGLDEVVNTIFGVLDGNDDSADDPELVKGLVGILEGVYGRSDTSWMPFECVTMRILQLFETPVIQKALSRDTGPRESVVSRESVSNALSHAVSQTGSNSTSNTGVNSGANSGNHSGSISGSNAGSISGSNSASNSGSNHLGPLRLDSKDTVSKDPGGNDTGTSQSNPTQGHGRIQLAGALANLLGQSLLTQERQARFLYGQLVALCQRTLAHRDTAAFAAVWAVLCRLRADSNGRILVTEPLLEESYAPELLSAQVSAPPAVAAILDHPSLVVNCNIIDRNQLLGLIRDALALGIPASASGPTPTSTDSDDRIFAMVLVNTPSQLANMRLFGEPEHLAYLRDIRDWAYGILTARRRVVTHAIVTVHLLTILLARDDLFGRPEHDRLVQQLVLAMGSWDASCHWAIHCLVTCCYECPPSIQKMLPQILSRLQTKITTKVSSMFILQFLLSLSLVESLTDNFTLQDFKRVFGMCFIYIQNTHELLARPATADAAADVNAEVVAQYQQRLAYTTICYLYLAIDVGRRHAIAPYLVRNLVLADNDPRNLDPMSLAAYDFIIRFTYSDLGLSLHSGMLSSPPNQHTADWDTRRWLRGAVVIEHRVHRSTGESVMVVRRPTNTLVTLGRPALRPPVPENGDATHESPELFSANMNMISVQELRGDDRPQALPIPIPVTPASNRAIAALDRVAVLDFYKVGIVYIGPGQKNEAEILANTTGSPAYRRFLGAIGTLVRLRGNRSFYAGGLDTSEDTDGEWAVGWRSKISQIIFHTTTLMPNAGVGEEVVAPKKRHIGNDYVNIYFDESGHQFNFELVRSQFNFINIVVTATHMPGKWCVRAYHRPGLNNELSAYELKVVSEPNLALFVRNVALKACQYATVHSMAGEYTDNWVYRLRLIEQLRDRIGPRETTEGSGDVEDVDTDRDTEASGSTEDEKRPIELLNWMDFTKWTA